MRYATAFTDTRVIIRFVLTTLINAPAKMQSVAGVSGLTVSVVVTRPDGATITETVAAYDLGDGAYSYILTAENCYLSGLYRVVFTTTSTVVDCQSITEHVWVEIPTYNIPHVAQVA